MNRCSNSLCKTPLLSYEDWIEFHESHRSTLLRIFVLSVSYGFSIEAISPDCAVQV